MRADLTNAEFAELLALEAESSRPPTQRALRRASRRAFLWDEEAVALIRSRRPLTELSGVGPYIARLIRDWIKSRPRTPPPPPIRSGFLTIAEARAALTAKNQWLAGIKGDLQMHSQWSDGSSTIASRLESRSCSAGRERRMPNFIGNRLSWTVAASLYGVQHSICFVSRCEARTNSEFHDDRRFTRMGRGSPRL